MYNQDTLKPDPSLAYAKFESVCRRNDSNTAKRMRLAGATIILALFLAAIATLSGLDSYSPAQLAEIQKSAAASERMFDSQPETQAATGHQEQ